MTAIQNEHPQTLALILSYATPEQASKIIANLPQETRVDVVERIAAMDLSLIHISAWLWKYPSTLAMIP